MHRLQDRTQPGLLAVAAQQADHPGQVFAALDGVLHLEVKVQPAHVVGDQVQQRTALELVAAVEHFLLEVGVHRLDAASRVEEQHEHFRIEAGADLFDGGEFFTQGGQFLLQTRVEHSWAFSSGEARRLLPIRFTHFIG